MASRPFAQIECTLLKSKKMRALKSNDARYAYACVHLSELGNYSGFFRYPKIMWADDACLTADLLEDVISDLVANGLIEYDHDEQLVRVIGWFHKRNAPENASRMMSLISDYQIHDTDNEDMLLRSISEFVVGAVRRAQRWKPNSDEWPKLRTAFKPFLGQLLQDYGDDFLEALTDEVSATNRATKAEIHSLMPAMQSWNQPPLYHPPPRVAPHETETIRDLNENNTNKLDENDTAAILAVSVESPSSRDSQSEELLRKTAHQGQRASKPLGVTLGSSIAQEAIKSGR